MGSILFMTIVASGFRSRISSTTRRIPRTTISSEHCMRARSFMPRTSHHTWGLKSWGISSCWRRQRTLAVLSPAIPKANPSTGPPISFRYNLSKIFPISGFPLASGPSFPSAPPLLMARTTLLPSHRPSIASTTLSPKNATSMGGRVLPVDSSIIVGSWPYTARYKSTSALFALCAAFQDLNSWRDAGSSGSSHLQLSLSPWMHQ
mmetsp:Transcript_4076/g.10360  ORF Transcript_4076/g.10360 Transcript_4076/m.10360 type:complete len:205 (-) Transcript_4076:395-1009(-)